MDMHLDGSLGVAYVDDLLFGPIVDELERSWEIVDGHLLKCEVPE
jgi:hypothetical protein